MFQEVISRGKKGEEVCRILLSTILNRPIGQVKVTAQKIILGTDTNLHGIRMDAYIESEETTDMDVELEPAIHNYVSEVKQDREVGVQYMKSWEREALIREEGKEEGRKSGILEGEQRIKQLILKLKEAGRIEDIIKAASDTEYQQQLLKEYGLVDL